MNSLNEEKGATINELEMLFTIVERLLSKEIDEHPTRALILAKGKSNEKRMSLVDALEAFRTLRSGMEIKGVTSLGICGTCTRWDCRGSTTKRIGTCGNTTTGRYDTCKDHSKIGGGFGLL